MITIGFLDGKGPVILNVFRAINVVGLLTAAAACAIIISRTTSRDSAGWWFFNSAEYAFAILSCLFLIGSELPTHPAVRRYYETHWPEFSHQHGLYWLGIVELILSMVVLGSLYNPSRRIDGPFRRVVLAGGFLALVNATISLLLGLFYNLQADRILNARTVRSRKAFDAASSLEAGSVRSFSNSSTAAMRNTPAKTGGGRLGALFGGNKKATASNGIRNISGPSNARPVQATAAPRAPSPARHPESWNDRASPINPKIRRPPTVDHPIFQSKESPRYSVAHITRWTKNTLRGTDADVMDNKI